MLAIDGYLHFLEIEDDDDGYDAAYVDDWIQSDRLNQPREELIDIEPVTSVSNVYYDENNGMSSAKPRNGEHNNIEIVKNTQNVYYDA